MYVHVRGAEATSPVQGLRRSAPEATRILTERRVSGAHDGRSRPNISGKSRAARTLSRRDSDKKRNPRFCAEERRRLPLALGPAARPPKMSSDVQARIRFAEHPARTAFPISNEVTGIHLSDSSNCQFPVITVTWRRNTKNVLNPWLIKK
ncbi:hypothetical protein EAG_12968 [Camponotus floridanus]|uniref:Uncharacterized protein n=1 Tax=Camponotus floridanus TaxID=104421 RepID=E2AND3_CAMFO|nr:hypothetical protein EAG_12968 [Camponotus floridanus]